MRAPQLNCSVVALLFVALVFGTFLTGCKSTGPRAQREIALLRAEILDLEDQFYSMKSRYESANRELQMCRGIPMDGTYLGSTTIEGEFIDGEYVEGEYVEGEFIEGEYIEGEYVEGEIIDYGPPEAISYDVPTRTGRYIPHAAETFRDSARRIFGRSNGQAQSQQQFQPNQRRGLFSGLGLGLLRRNQQPDTNPDFATEMEIVIPPYESQSRATQPEFASTPTLSNELASRRDANAVIREPLDTNSADLDISYGDERADSYSPQDGVVFDEVERLDSDDVYNIEDAVSGSSNRPGRETLVARIDINSSSTRGEDVDGQPGHEGVVVLIQPKDRNGLLVKQTGEVSVSLIDPTAAGEEQRVGLWKFTPQEMRLFEVKDERSEQGYLLHLPWEGNTPVGQDLLLYVRYWTNDGRRLETSTRLSIDPPATTYSADSPLIEGWTRRDPRWDRGKKSSTIPSQQSLLADDPRIPDLKGASGGSTGGQGAGRSLKATPASSTIKPPTWRPSR